MISQKFSEALECHMPIPEKGIPETAEQIIEMEPQLAQPEEPTLTEEIIKDESAIEECCDCLDTALIEQSKLIKQVEDNEGSMDNPSIKTITTSEEALDYALARLKATREDFGLHYRTSTSLKLSNEGIKDFLANIGKAIKELFRKVIMFFKKLFAKLRIKLANYSERLDKLNKEMKKLSKDNSTLINSVVIDEVRTALNDLGLANVSFFVSEMNVAPLHICKVSSLANDVKAQYSFFKNAIKAMNGSNPNIQDVQKIIVDLKSSVIKIFTTKNVTNADIAIRIGDTAIKKGNIIQAVNNSASYDLPVSQSTPGQTSKLATTPASYSNIANVLSNGFTRSSAGFYPLGCAGTNFYGIIMETSNDFNPGETHLLEPISAEFVQPVQSLDLKALVDSFMSHHSAVKKATDETNKIFKDIDAVYENFKDFASEIEKIDTDSIEAQKIANALARNVKKLAIDVPNFLIKTHVHTIRDYLVIGNVILAKCNSRKPD